MEQRLGKMQVDAATLRGKLEALENEEQELEERRKDLLPQANVRRMVEIKAGPFPMGSRADDSPNKERPVHVVYLPTYYISPFPVMNIEYREFVNCTGYKAPMHWQRGSYPTGTGRHPVTNVSWHDAKAYAEWLGARLPTEAEWEKAARGTDERLYPWGSRFGEDRCNCTNLMGGTLPVDEYPNGRSPYGLWDMAGNTYEWCEDYYDENYYKFSPNNNPKGPEGGQERVVRGGSYQENRTAVRTTHREGTGEHITREVQGFRIAMSEPRDNDNRSSAPREESRTKETPGESAEAKS
jgi:iron(II)-dependent oxidoreductase